MANGVIAVMLEHLLKVAFRRRNPRDSLRVERIVVAGCFAAVRTRRIGQYDATDQQQVSGDACGRYHGTNLFIKFIGRMLLLILPMS